MSRIPDIRTGEEITAAFLNASKNEGVLEIRVGSGLRMQQQGRVVILDANPQTSPLPQTPFLQAMIVKEIFANYLRCRRYDFPSTTEDSTDVYVAKHWLCHHDRTQFESTNGTGQTLTTVDVQTVDASGASDETWKTTHDHIVGKPITAGYVAGGTGIEVSGEHVFWQELGPRQFGVVPAE